MPRSNDLLNKVVHLCKTLGFVFESRLASDGSPVPFYNYTYGPFGVQAKHNIQNEWWHEIVTSRDIIHGLELSILQHAHLNGEELDNSKSSLGFLALRRDQLAKRITDLVSSKPKSSHVEDTVPGVCPEVEDFFFSCRSFLREDCNFKSLEHFNNLAGILNVSQVPFGIAQYGKFFSSSTKDKFLFR